MAQTDKLIQEGIKKLGFVMIACNMIGIFIYKAFFGQYYFSFYPCLVLIMFAISSISISTTAKAIERDNSTFVNITMVTSVIKMLLLVITFLLYAWLVRENLVSCFVSFVILYVIFTAFETVFRAKLNRSQNELDKK